MPIYRDNKKVVAIYRGGEKVTKAYRGEQVVFSSVVKLGNVVEGMSSPEAAWKKIRLNNETIDYTVNSDGSFAVDLSEVPSEITSTNLMFVEAIDKENTTMTSIHLTDKFDISKVTDMSGMFRNMPFLRSLTFDKPLDTSKVTNMSGMFSTVGNRTSPNPLDWSFVQDLDVSKVTNMSYMFSNANFKQLELLDLTKWKLNKDVNIQSMFFNISANQIDISGWSITVPDNATPFYGASGDIIADNLTFNGTSIGKLLTSVSNLSTVSMKNPNLTGVSSMNNTFYNHRCSIDLSTWDMSTIKSTRFLFLYSTLKRTTGLDKWDVSNMQNMYKMFNGANELDLTQIENWDTSSCLGFSYMFAETTYTSIDLSHWNCDAVSKYVTLNHNDNLFNSMFYNCSNLQVIDISGFKILDNVYVIDKNPYCFSMFQGCSALTTIHFSDEWNMNHLIFDTSTFQGCSALTTITGTWKNLNKSLNMHWSPLTHDSALIILNALIEVTNAQTLTLSKTTYATLTEDEIATATAKNWTIAQA